mgnify:CR=1 FL=1
MNIESAFTINSTDQQGYFSPHCEQGAAYPHRMMAWTLYLNDSPCGTEFPYQEMIVHATQGQGAIWAIKIRPKPQALHLL